MNLIPIKANMTELEVKGMIVDFKAIREKAIKECLGLDHQYNPVTLMGNCVECGGTVKSADKPIVATERERNDSGVTPTPGKMREILVSMTYDGDVHDATIIAALESNDDPLRAYIVRAVNSHEELIVTLRTLIASLESIDSNIDHYPDAFGGSTHSIVRMIHNDIAIAKETIAKAERSSNPHSGEGK